MPQKIRILLSGLLVFTVIYFISIWSWESRAQTEDAATPAATSLKPKDSSVVPKTAADEEPATDSKEPLPVSIFFTPEEQEQIRAALIAYENSKNNKINDAENKATDFLNQLTGIAKEPEKPKEERTFVYPQFFLNSIVFHTLDDWFVLINNQRFSAKSAEESAELSIIGVDKEKVLVEWKPKNMQKVNETWANAENDDAVVDKARGVVAFTLRPNQTFSSYVMRVLEGKVVPVVIILKPDEDKDGQVQSVLPAAKPDADNKKIENITTDDIKNDVGMKGLNKTYKRLGLEN